jgi:hypothetical protein
MKKYIPYIVTLAAIAGWVVVAGNRAQAQTTDLLLADSTDQSEFPQVTAQPVDQAVPIGSDAVLSVQAVNADGFQWLRNGAPVDGETNSSLVIQDVVINDAGLYSCEVSKANGEVVPTRTATLNVTACLPGGGPIIVFGTPYLGGGSQGTCPGPFAGYVNYIKPSSQGWGWAPIAGTAHTATDLNRNDTKVEYVGRYGDSGCDETTVSIPDPTISPKYRFTIYFPNNVPTNAYPIMLTGFNP